LSATEVTCPGCGESVQSFRVGMVEHAKKCAPLRAMVGKPKRPEQPVERVRYQVNCPGCGKRVRAPTLDDQRARVLRHVRNCNAMKQAGAPVVPESQVPQP
jgi:endogenous inhibitor of DNA gyrase (YacG/DUF329 family)